jgi:5-methylthioadenosine/S-adenosylhomocysteine deaminase
MTNARGPGRQIVLGGLVLTMNARGDTFAPGVVVIDGPRIAHVGPEASWSPDPGDDLVDCHDQLVMPGLVNTHTHTCAALFRGLAEDRSRAAWAGYTLPWQDRAGAEAYHFGSILGALEQLTSGVTCIADRFSYMDTCAEAFDRVGIRAVVGHTLFDIGGALEWPRAVALLERWGTAPESRVHAGLAPHAPDTCSDDLLRRIRIEADARAARVFIHCAQSEAEVAAVRARGHTGPVHCLAATGLLGPDVVAAHCIYVDAGEIRRLAATGTWVAHCPASNAKTEGRLPPVAAMLDAGVAMALGTDWAPSNNGMDLFDEMKSAGLLNKVGAGDPAALPVDRLLAMATIDGARALGLDGYIGSLEPGKLADVITLAMDAWHLLPWHRPAATLVYSAKGRDVRNVWVDGRRLVRQGQAADWSLATIRGEIARVWRDLRAGKSVSRSSAVR